MSEAESLWEQAAVRRYRETDGAVGHIWRRGSKILLLTTNGRNTGTPGTMPLIYDEDAGRLERRTEGGAPSIRAGIGTSSRPARRGAGGGRCLPCACTHRIRRGTSAAVGAS